MLNRRKSFGTRSRSRNPNLAPVRSLTGRVSRVSKRKAFWSVCVVESAHGTDSRYQMKREGIILDAGKRGARVRFRSKAKLPDRVTVKAPRLGLARDAEIIWQDEFDAGMKFVAD